LLRVADIAVEAGGVRLFAGLSLELGEGERVALTGPSGCGKTTLLRAVAGLIDPCAGEILLHGRPPETFGWPAYRRQVVLVDQRPILFDETVRFNLEKPFTYRTAGATPWPAARAAELLEAFGLGARRLDQPARSLSQGQQQRVALVRALLLAPAILLLDEPTSALDPESVELVEERLVAEARGQGLGALVVTHDRHQAHRLCDRVLDLQPYMVAPGGGDREAAGSREVGDG